MFSYLLRSFVGAYGRRVSGGNDLSAWLRFIGSYIQTSSISVCQTCAATLPGVTCHPNDTLNRISNITDLNQHSFGFTYDVLGRRTQLTRSNGVTTNYGYDNMSNLLSVAHQNGAATLDGAPILTT